MNTNDLKIGMLINIRKHRDNNSIVGRIRIKQIEECPNFLFIKINGYIYYRCQIESVILEHC